MDREQSTCSGHTDEGMSTSKYIPVPFQWVDIPLHVHVAADASLSVCVMNFISDSFAVSLYPLATFVHKRSASSYLMARIPAPQPDTRQVQKPWPSNIFVQAVPNTTACSNRTNADVWEISIVGRSSWTATRITRISIIPSSQTLGVLSTTPVEGGFGWTAVFYGLHS